MLLYSGTNAWVTFTLLCGMAFNAGSCASKPLMLNVGGACGNCMRDSVPHGLNSACGWFVGGLVTLGTALAFFRVQGFM